MNKDILSLSMVFLFAGCVSLDFNREASDPKLEKVLEIESQIATLQHGMTCGDDYQQRMPRLLDQRVREYWSWGIGKDKDTRQPTSEERLTIEGLMLQKGKEPIMSIKMCGTRRAIVETGVVRGPLAGGGSDYYLVKEKGGWRIAFRSGWVS